MSSTCINAQDEYSVALSNTRTMKMSQEQPKKNLLPMLIWLAAAAVGILTLVNTFALVGIISYLFGTGA